MPWTDSSSPCWHRGLTNSVTPHTNSTWPVSACFQAAIMLVDSSHRYHSSKVWRLCVAPKLQALAIDSRACRSRQGLLMTCISSGHSSSERSVCMCTSRAFSAVRIFRRIVRLHGDVRYSQQPVSFEEWSWLRRREAQTAMLRAASIAVIWGKWTMVAFWVASLLRTRPSKAGARKLLSPPVWPHQESEDSDPRATAGSC